MNGKVAVVTGATSGIGRASSLFIAKQGIKRLSLLEGMRREEKLLKARLLLLGGELFTILKNSKKFINNTMMIKRL
jgi:NADP-dependent 3-hydroxy acid dehydrogenase YdfG